jgi:sugar phosphate isomerase/epimerase
MNSESAVPLNKDMRFTRREILASAAAFAGAAESLALGAPSPAASGKPVIALFSKPLSFLPAVELGRAANELGFESIDLAVRPGGHVEPDRVRVDLPLAVKAIRSAGVEVSMLTTGIIDASTPHAEDVIATMTSLGITRYRWGGFRWSASSSFEQQIEAFRPKVSALAEINSRYKATAMYHTHSGVGLVGASIWDLHEIFRGLDPELIAVNYDVGHATVEGGLGGWIDSFHITGPRLKGVAVKDFLWELDGRGRWEPAWKPLGSGMVRLSEFLRMLRQSGFAGPVQLHFEYPLGGAEQGLKTGIMMSRDDIFSAIRRDLGALRAAMKAADLA